MWHNDILKIRADLHTTVCNDVEKEPIPQPCLIAKGKLHADFAVCGFW